MAGIGRHLAAAREAALGRRMDAAQAVRVLGEQGTHPRLEAVPGRAHGDVLAVRTHVLAGAARCHGRQTGVPGAETVP